MSLRRLALGRGAAALYARQGGDQLTRKPLRGRPDLDPDQGAALVVIVDPPRLAARADAALVAATRR